MCLFCCYIHCLHIESTTWNNFHLLSKCINHETCTNNCKVLVAHKNCEINTASTLQEQGGLKVSWKLCLRLCSLRWLPPKRNLAKSLIPSLSETLNKLLGVGFINFRYVFLKTSHDTDLRISKLIFFST